MPSIRRVIRLPQLLSTQRNAALSNVVSPRVTSTKSSNVSVNKRSMSTSTRNVVTVSGNKSKNASMSKPIDSTTPSLKTVFMNSVERLHTHVQNGQTTGVAHATADMISAAMDFHATEQSDAVVSEAHNRLHTIFSSKANNIRAPSVSELTSSMKKIHIAVSSGTFFEMSMEEQLSLFQPLTFVYTMQRAGIDFSDADKMVLLESIFKENYHTAARGLPLGEMSSLHEALLHSRAFRDMTDKIDTKKSSDKPTKKSGNESDKEKDEKPVNDNEDDKEKENDQNKDDQNKDDQNKDGKDEDGKDKDVEKDAPKQPEKDSVSKEERDAKMSDMWDNIIKDAGFKADQRVKKEKKDGDEDKEEDSDKRSSNEMKKILPSSDKTMNILWATLGLSLLLAVIALISDRKERASHNYETFLKYYMAGGYVESIYVGGNTVRVHLRRNTPSHDGSPISKYAFDFVSDRDFAQRLREDCKSLNIPEVPVVVGNSDTSAFAAVLGLVPYILIFMVLRKFSSGDGLLKGMRNPFANKKKFNMVKDVKTRFKDVAGLEESKREIMEFVDFLKNPERYKKLGAKLPKGALLSGPPGTGKTLLARATAGESGVPFFSVSGSEFQEMFVGVGASRVRELFATARKNAPAIVFIDEIDAVARSRSHGKMGGNDEREATLNQMLVEMDGFETDIPIVVLAGTNRSDMLDPAITRSGRFDRKITVDAPDIKGRAEIFLVHLRNIVTNVDKNEVSSKLAALTPGMVGADIANVCNEAAIFAARDNAESVELVHFEKAIDRMIAGLEKKNHILTPEERRTVAYHEAGHAVVGWMLEYSEPLLKVTIVPRSNGALGFAQYLPRESSLYATDALCDMICMALGGRAAEETFFKKITTGASDDIRRTTSIAKGMVTKYGMSEELYNMYLHHESDAMVAPFSEATSQVIDKATKHIVDSQYRRCLDVVEANRDKIEKLAEALLERETINHDGLVEILGERRVQSDAYVKYLEAQRLAVQELDEEARKKQEEEVAATREEDAKLTEKERKSTTDVGEKKDEDK